jgi:uroporphyrin-3 C-methyltransferase
VSDLTVLTIRLDEVMRQVDDLPLVAAVDVRGPGDGASRASAAAAPNAGADAQAAATGAGSWLSTLKSRWQFFSQHVWAEAKSLVRVSRIDQPEALLLAPEQAYFLRENLKLRLLNARLSLLARQYETAQYDLRDAQSALDRYFDRSSRRVLAASELLRQTSAQARQVAVPRPDATLAAIATAVAGR